MQAVRCARQLICIDEGEGQDDGGGKGQARHHLVVRCIGGPQEDERQHNDKCHKKGRYETRRGVELQHTAGVAECAFRN
jgi:hypothetical protein